MSLFYTKNPTLSWILSLFFIVTGWQLCLPLHNVDELMVPLPVGSAAKSNSCVESVFYCEVIITCCITMKHITLHYSCCRMRRSTIVLGACSPSRPAILISQMTSQQSSHGDGSQRSATGVTQLHSPSYLLSPLHLSSVRSLLNSPLLGFFSVPLSSLPFLSPLSFLSLPFPPVASDLYLNLLF